MEPKPHRMVDDEHYGLRTMLEDDELAQAATDADDETAVVLLLNANRYLVALMLWRNRTGADLATAKHAVAQIAERHDISF